METWKKAWREGFAPQLTAKGLEALKLALETDDPRLLQGATCQPPPLMCISDWPAEAACAVGFCGWQGEGLESVAEVNDFFAGCCAEADRRLGDYVAAGEFLCWLDDTPRAEMRRDLLAEVIRELTNRAPMYHI